MELSSTSTQRTYRHLRLALVGAAVMMLAALVVVVGAAGPVTSLSALYYTPGGPVFGGALFAIALALVALSGHSVEQVLLDIAALFAALIAVVPTPIDALDAPGAGRCPVAGVACVPPAAAAAMGVGVIVVAIMGLLGSLTAAWLGGRRAPAMPLGVAVPAAVVAAVSIGALVWLGVAPGGMLAFGHVVAAGSFFVIMTAVSVVSAITARGRWRVLYVVVAAGMGASLGYLAVVFTARLAGVGRGLPLVLVGEVALIALFAMFWLAQTAQKWNAFDPAVTIVST